MIMILKNTKSNVGFPVTGTVSRRTLKITTVESLLNGHLPTTADLSIVVTYFRSRWEIYSYFNLPTVTSLSKMVNKLSSVKEICRIFYTRSTIICHCHCTMSYRNIRQQTYPGFEVNWHKNPSKKE